MAMLGCVSWIKAGWSEYISKETLDSGRVLSIWSEGIQIRRENLAFWLENEERVREGDELG